MLTAILSGGLGNQLFQIFAVLAHHVQYGSTFTFPDTIPSEHVPVRTTYWNSLLISIAPRISPVESILSLYELYREPLSTYNPIPIFPPDSKIALMGLYQSPMYFDSVRDQVFDLAGIPQIRERIHAEYESEMFNERETVHYVSMHFRIGDYASKRCYHPIIPIEYYANAIRRVLDCVDAKRIVVWCFFEELDASTIRPMLDTLRTTFGCVAFREVLPNIEDWKQMVLMSCCDDHIIANSTFSWWGAYLNPSLTKHVYYPDKWYGHLLYYIQTADMYPSEWTRVSVDAHIGCDCWVGESLSR